MLIHRSQFQKKHQEIAGIQKVRNHGMAFLYFHPFYTFSSTSFSYFTIFSLYSYVTFHLTKSWMNQNFDFGVQLTEIDVYLKDSIILNVFSCSLDFLCNSFVSDIFKDGVFTTHDFFGANGFDLKKLST